MHNLYRVILGMIARNTDRNCFITTNMLKNRILFAVTLAD